MVDYYSIKLTYDTRRSRDSATFNNTYQTLGIALTRPIRLFKIVNNSDQDIDVSTDGVNAHDFCPKGGFLLYDLTANRVEHLAQSGAFFALGTQFYVKGAAAGTGSVYLVCIA